MFISLDGLGAVGFDMFRYIWGRGLVAKNPGG